MKERTVAVLICVVPVAYIVIGKLWLHLSDDVMSVPVYVAGVLVIVVTVVHTARGIVRDRRHR